jgi:MinD superfamily P-loop ATPase
MKAAGRKQKNKIVNMSISSRRIIREKKTAEAMIRIFCRNLHQTKKELCQECKKLLDYAQARLEKCPFLEKKTTCANCRIHCYKPAMRERIKEVMRYAGHRMTSRHPILAFYHFLDGFRKEPGRKSKGTP